MVKARQGLDFVGLGSSLKDFKIIKTKLGVKLKVQLERENKSQYIANIKELSNITISLSI